MKRPNRNPLLALAAASLLAATGAIAQPKVAATPMIPVYGQSVKLQLSNTEWPIYLPATRFTRSGSNVVIEYEMMSNNFDVARSDFGYQPVDLGELPPGNYTVTARVFDMANPGAPRQEVTSQFAVVPPQDWGVYTVPQYPDAFQPTYVTIRSAAYFDAATMKASVSGNVIRVDFDYAPDAPATGVTPPGLTTFASVEVGKLNPGAYKVEAWGRPRSGGAYEKYFTRDISVDSTAVVHEFYHPMLDHYFMAAGPDEVAGLDASTSDGWQRTGLGFRAWLRAADAPAGARPVCRFYAAGPNSHFYTADPAECQTLKNLEASGRAEAAAQQTRFWGWAYEGIAFHALLPTNGQCPGGTDPVWRTYNNRAQQRDTNHRFMTDERMRIAMRWTWIDEGAAFCSPR
jgi:hypothetical protein